MSAGYTPSYNATVVSKLVENGCIVLGKNNMDEFGMGSHNQHSAAKPCSHPVHPTRVPGGSSGGSAAAVTSGAVLAAIATDTGGSVRLPAAYCGVTGFKPSYGRISRHGLIAYASSLDTIGTSAE